MTIPNIKAELRGSEEIKKTNHLKNLGYIPGVIYRAGKETKEVKMNSKELSRHINRHGVSGTLTLELEGKPVLALIKEVQRDVIKGNVIHIDLQELSSTEKQRVSIPLVIQGKEKMEASSSAIVLQQLMELDVECLPKHITSNITVDINDLKVGDVLNVSNLDIVNDKNYEIITDINDVVLSIVAARKSEPEVEEVEEA